MTDTASEACIRLSKRLKSLRQARGFKTARSFASQLDIHENRYTRYERAEVEPDLELLVKFCSVLRITPNDLLSEAIEFASPPGNALTEAAGFREAGQGSFASSAGNQASNQADNRFAAEVMALSTLLAEIELDYQNNGSASPADTLRRSGELYEKIMASPFSVLPSIGAQIPIHSADLEKQAQVAAQIKAILAHYRSAPAQ
ncbi:MAG: helix-turn-helix transcriptional regulator [Pseudomonadota bacterium]